MKLIDSTRVLHPLLAAAAVSFVAQAQAVLHEVHGDSNGDFFGRSVALLSDVNSDGVEDFAVGSPFDDPAGLGARPGAVHIYSGATGALLRTIVGDGQDSEFGHALAVISDITGDGVAELLIGAPSRSYSLQKQGAAYVYSPKSGAKLRSHFGISNNAYCGTSVAALGDLNGDGLNEYAVGTPFHDENGLLNVGLVQVFTTTTGALLRDWPGAVPGAEFGFSVASAGDYNGDGFGDVVVGEPFWNTQWPGAPLIGRARVISGMNGLLDEIWGTEAQEQCGYSVALIGDITSDGNPEVAVGAPYCDGTGWNRGRVTVMTDSLGTPVYVLDGPQDGSEFGYALTALGNWSVIGPARFAVGIPGYNLLGSGAIGAVRIYDGPSGSVVTTLLGSDADGEFGCALASGQDLNNDGRRELAIGSFVEDGSGAARVMFGDVSRPYRYCTAKVNSLGCTPLIDYTGAPSLTVGDNFHITASSILDNKSGTLFWGFTQNAAPFKGGTLCVGQPLVRTTLQNSGSSASATCGGNFDFHFGESLMQTYHLSAGQHLFAQYWYRDPGFSLPNNIGLTAGLAFEIAP